MSITQELLSLVTGLAHYLKILIRIALTSALKLERDYGDRTGILQFLSRLDRLARDPDASKATSSQPNHPSTVTPTASSSNLTPASGGSNMNQSVVNGKPRAYGYKSLTRAVGTLFGQGEATTDLCEICKQTVEEECVRFGTSLRWHTSCLRCSTCNRSPTKSDKSTHPAVSNDGQHPPQMSTLPIKRFRLEIGPPRDGSRSKTLQIFCEECSQTATRTMAVTGLSGLGLMKEGFEGVTRLEQYAFLLCVALNKLYGLLKQRGVLPTSK